MEKVLLKISCFLLLTTIFVSCSSKTKIEINFDENQKGLLVFDKKDTVKIVADSAITYMIEQGDHSFVLNKEKPQTINVPTEGGILNLKKMRYIRFYQNYGSDNFLGLQSKIDVVAIDSMIYVYKRDSTEVVSDELIKSELENSLNITSSNSIKLYNADLFIPKDWDYGLTEKLPDTITVQSNSGVLVSDCKTKLIEERLFRLGAMLTPSYFIIKKKKDIINNVGDKKLDEERKKKQLEF